MKSKKNLIKVVAGALVLLALFGAVCFLVAQNYWLRESKLIFQEELSQTRGGFSVLIDGLKNEINGLEISLGNTKKDLEIALAQRDNIGMQYNDAVNKYQQERANVANLSSQIGEMESEMEILAKLQNTDEELLAKYSKVYFLNENYIPESFSAIDPYYCYDPDESYLVYSKIYPFLQVMMATAVADEIDIQIISAYRSFEEQSDLKASYKVVYGSGANQFSADQGYSEHQLGTAIDFTTSQIGAAFDGFEKTKAYRWLLDNAHEYGFVLSYPEDNGYYQYEPWHWRFVGRELAKKLHNESKYFYDLDQREIDEYLISFFD